MKAKDAPRLAVTSVLLGLFIYAVTNHYSPAVEQTVVNLSILAAGYWLGSSKGSSHKTEMLADRPSGNPGDPVHVEEDDG